ncbi:transaldolase [Nocardioides guangzhouensis]|uniref:Transaldolase n=1 Tax=Nocardioides guangzhouensis TaxID=2497878 RepID=A0A4Q4Z9C3_9ACTN|nr:transaldolase family protein [Nocardioides guangzhouensis]RYP84452.1 transaldolase [Nocardioides guangzhouensis]
MHPRTTVGGRTEAAATAFTSSRDWQQVRESWTGDADPREGASSVTTTRPRDAGGVSGGPRTVEPRWGWPAPWPLAPPPPPRSGDPRLAAPRGTPAGLGLGGLSRLYRESAQSPWRDALVREDLEDGSLARHVAAGVRGLCASPAVFARRLGSSARYREQLSWLTSTGCSAAQVYREVAAADVQAACAVLGPTFEGSPEPDGLVSLDVAPPFVASTRTAVAAAHRLHHRIDRPNFIVGIRATAQGVPAIQALVTAGRSVNATSICSLRRYRTVLEAYVAGMEAFVARGGNPANVYGVATFAVALVDTSVDSRLAVSTDSRAAGLLGAAGVAQATLAHRLFTDCFSTSRWRRLADLGARPQRLAFSTAGTDVTSPQVRRYVRELVLPNTVHALSKAGIAALDGNPAPVSTLPAKTQRADAVLADLAHLGIDLDVIGLALEDKAAAQVQGSFARALARIGSSEPR